MQGAFRRVLGQPKNVRSKLLRYTDPHIDLALSDEDRLLGMAEPRDVPEGRFVALQLSFELASSAYATMLLREVLKTDTSSQSQKELTSRGEDQAYRGSGGGGAGGRDGGRGGINRADVNFISGGKKRAWGAASAA